MADALSCSVSFEGFPAGATFALHVAFCTCTSLLPTTPPSTAAHCARYLHMYATGGLAHEISFHQHDCARVNELPDAASTVKAAVPKSRRRCHALLVQLTPVRQRRPRPAACTTAAPVRASPTKAVWTSCRPPRQRQTADAWRCGSVWAACTAANAASS
ncbi:hypothetical protein KRP22_000314 [Phytophthora ramorum]|nr:hypothetical protein KRP22_12260 [Phytophthora ramorum]